MNAHLAPFENLARQSGSLPEPHSASAKCLRELDLPKTRTLALDYDVNAAQTELAARRARDRLDPILGVFAVPHLVELRDELWRSGGKRVCAWKHIWARQRQFSIRAVNPIRLEQRHDVPKARCGLHQSLALQHFDALRLIHSQLAERCALRAHRAVNGPCIDIQNMDDEVVRVKEAKRRCWNGLELAGRRWLTLFGCGIRQILGL